MNPDLLRQLRELSRAPGDATRTPTPRAPRQMAPPVPVMRDRMANAMPVAPEPTAAQQLAQLVAEIAPGSGEGIAVRRATDDAMGGRYGEAAGELGLAALGVLPMGNALKGLKNLVRGADEARDAGRGITVYHGTPGRFAPEPDAPAGRFRLDKMGSGEGAQMYGWGGYFADAPEVSKKYRDMERHRLSAWTYDGVPVERQFRQFTPEHRAVTMLWGAGRDAQKAADKQREYIARLEGYEAQYPGQRIYAERIQEEKDVLDRLLALSGEKLQPPQGTLYEVQLDVDPVALLDWDRPLKEQPGEMLRSLRQITPSIKGSMIGGEGYMRAGNYLANLANEDRRWADLIGDLEDRLDVDLSTTATRGQINPEDVDRWLTTLGERRGEMSAAELTKARAVLDDPAKAVSLHLGDVNVPGLRYLDEYSRPGGRNAASPTRNYVIWNEQRIKVLRALAALGVVGAAEELARLEQGAPPDGGPEGL